MGINHFNLKVNDTPINAKYNLTHLNPNLNQNSIHSDKPNLSGNKSSTRSFINTTVSLKIFHQNIRGLRDKTDELVLHLLDCLPQVLCLTEHHLKELEIKNLGIRNYKLGAYHCRKIHRFGGVGIYIQDNLSCTPICLTKFCSEQDLEICALKIINAKKVICIICMYRPPMGNLETFMHLLQSALEKIYTNSMKLVICGDININYLKNCSYKAKLDSLLATYNLQSIVDFPTRITENSYTAIDNIFLNKGTYPDYFVEPFINGLSDHDAQMVTL
jgi:exonuclease III